MAPGDIEQQAKVSTGIAGLDEILMGGPPACGSYLVQGSAGTGKTTLGLQFLLRGVEEGERTLFFLLGHSRRQLARIAGSHGWSLAGMEVHPFTVEEMSRQLAVHQTVFPTHEVELSSLIGQIREVVGRVRPRRVVFDAISQIRLLANDTGRYRREVIALRSFFEELEVSVLLLDTVNSGSEEDELHALADGVIELEQLRPNYGSQRFQLMVTKMRGMAFQGGYHDYTIGTGGLRVFPRVVPLSGAATANWQPMSSGWAEIDALVGGGLETGTSCMMIGPSGVGKTTLCTLYAHEAAARGEQVAVFLFDERLDIFFRRSRALGMDVEAQVREGRIHVRQVETGTLSPGEFAGAVKQMVEEGARLVVIDSVTGYFSAMPQEHLLLAQMHNLTAFLSQHDVLTLFTVEQYGLAGEQLRAPVEVSNLADAIVFLRYFEAEGMVRKAISVLKKRSGDHEKTIRELSISRRGVRVSGALPMFNGVLTGQPVFGGEAAQLLGGQDDGD